MTKVQALAAYLGKCDPNQPLAFMSFIDRCQEYFKANGNEDLGTLRMALVTVMEKEAYHWFITEKSGLEDYQRSFLKSLQRKFKETVLISATRDLALLEPRSTEASDVREFLDRFYALSDVVEHFHPGSNMFGLLYKRLSFNEEAKQHLQGVGRQIDLLTNIIEIKKIIARQEYSEYDSVIQRALNTNGSFH
ncbi:hypothetical protein TRVA0_012S00562 [Trichomonascus vanleenenianus]|uniref:uncharacterized protein n=1 Tax=Trichomonascus vanleenenianus TaxID=2268995 RepID=UPI003ECA782C